MLQQRLLQHSTEQPWEPAKTALELRGLDARHHHRAGTGKMGGMLSDGKEEGIPDVWKSICKTPKNGRGEF